MKSACLFLLLAASLQAQVPDNVAFFGLGASYNPSSSPKAVGHVWFALEVSAKAKTYSWTAVDFLYGRGQKPTTAVETGVAQFVRKIGIASLYALGAAGPSVLGATGGTTVGGSLTYGGLLAVPIKGRFSLGFNVRSIKLVGAGATATQTAAGVDLIFGR